jgi:hypothetical protein
MILPAGMFTSAANMQVLGTAIKDLSRTAEETSAVLSKHGANLPQIFANADGNIFSPEVLSNCSLKLQLERAALQHAVLLAVDSAVFKSFRASALTTEGLAIAPSAAAAAAPAAKAAAAGGYEATAREVLLLQLQLEKKRVEAWLQLLIASDGEEEEMELKKHPTALHILNTAVNTANTVLTQSGMLLQWRDPVPYRGLGPEVNMASTNDEGAINLVPCSVLSTEEVAGAIRRVVLAGLKAQVIASAIHTRLVRLHVPGWQQTEDLLHLGPGPLHPEKESLLLGVVPVCTAAMVRKSLSAAKLVVGPMPGDCRYVAPAADTSGAIVPAGQPLPTATAAVGSMPGLHHCMASAEGTASCTSGALLIAGQPLPTVAAAAAAAEDVAPAGPDDEDSNRSTNSITNSTIWSPSSTAWGGKTESHRVCVGVGTSSTDSSICHLGSCASSTARGEKADSSSMCVKDGNSSSTYTGCCHVGSCTSSSAGVGTKADSSSRWCGKGLAVFCQEPAVVQLAGRVEALPE